MCALKHSIFKMFVTVAGDIHKMNSINMVPVQSMVLISPVTCFLVTSIFTVILFRIRDKYGNVVEWSRRRTRDAINLVRISAVTLFFCNMFEILDN